MLKEGKRFIQYLVNITVGCVIVFIAFMSFNQGVVKWNQCKALSEKRLELLESLKAKKAAISEIKENIERFNSDRDFVEDLARKSRRVTRSDIVFVFDENHKE